METIDGLDGEQWSQPDARHKAALARVRELELVMANKRALISALQIMHEELTATHAALMAENSRLTELLAPPPRVVTVDTTPTQADEDAAEYRDEQRQEHCYEQQGRLA